MGDFDAKDLKLTSVGDDPDEALILGDKKHSIVIEGWQTSGRFTAIPTKSMGKLRELLDYNRWSGLTDRAGEMHLIDIEAELVKIRKLLFPQDEL